MPSSKTMTPRTKAAARLAEFDQGFKVRVYHDFFEQVCIVPGCGKDNDKRFKGPTGWYCEPHGREVSKHDEPKKTTHLDSYTNLY